MVTICVAIAQPKGTSTLTIEELERGWKVNPDGGGFAYINEEGNIVTFKSMDMDTFILAYLDAHEKYGDDSPFVVHMRIATHGEIKLETTHPFTVRLGGKGEMVMAHNGIIGDVAHLTDDDTSDTMAFIEHVIEYLADDWLDNPVMVDFIDALIDYSKLVFLTTSPLLKEQLYIVNADAGMWDNGVWYSNSSCRARPAISYRYGSDKYVGWAKDYWEQRDKMLTCDAGTDFSDWLVDTDGINRELMFQPEEMRLATRDNWDDMRASAIVNGAACTSCMGKYSCYCEDTCAYCFEAWQTCDCSGDFVSLRTYEDEMYSDIMESGTSVNNGDSIVTENGLHYRVIYDDNDMFVRVERVDA